MCDTKMSIVTPVAVCKKPCMSQFDPSESPAHTVYFLSSTPLVSWLCWFHVAPITHSKQGLLLQSPTLPSHIYIILYILPPASTLLNPICFPLLSFFLPFCLFLVPQPKPTPICLLRGSDSRSNEKQSLPSLSFQVWIVKLYSRTLTPLHLACHHLGLNVDFSTWILKSLTTGMEFSFWVHGLNVNQPLISA